MNHSKDMGFSWLRSVNRGNSANGVRTVGFLVCSHVIGLFIFFLTVMFISLFIIYSGPRETNKTHCKSGSLCQEITNNPKNSTKKNRSLSQHNAPVSQAFPLPRLNAILCGFNDPLPGCSSQCRTQPWRGNPLDSQARPVSPKSDQDQVVRFSTPNKLSTSFDHLLSDPKDWGFECAFYGKPTGFYGQPNGTVKTST